MTKLRGLRARPDSNFIYVPAKNFEEFLESMNRQRRYLDKLEAYLDFATAIIALCVLFMCLGSNLPRWALVIINLCLIAALQGRQFFKPKNREI